MPTIHTTTQAQARYPLLGSWLRGLGLDVLPAGQDKPGQGDSHLCSADEPMPAARGVVALGDPAQRIAQTGADGVAARLAFGQDDMLFGHAFAAALLRGQDAPTAADPASLALFALAERVAASDITVLVNGPTGTGKEVLARHIHANSSRASGPFVAVNCAALPEAMLEALLFGHTKGAFTGAAQASQGFFRAANGGTLLLDEIAEMPLALQAKLLRVLQEREVVPLGATAPEPVDVRVVACANRDLPLEVAEGRFRADLYYRLSVFPLSTTALADRRQDVAALAAAMILRHVPSAKPAPWPTLETLDKLLGHDWPGNVRELENVIQRALLLAPGDRILPEHILFDQAARTVEAPTTVTPIDAGLDPSLGGRVRMTEYQAIRDTLAACGGNRLETARRLGISERTLRYRLARIRADGHELARPNRSMFG